MQIMIYAGEMVHFCHSFYTGVFPDDNTEFMQVLCKSSTIQYKKKAKTF